MLDPVDERIRARLFAAFAARRVRFALFGGLASAALGLARATEDVGLFLEGSTHRRRDRR